METKEQLAQERATQQGSAPSATDSAAGEGSAGGRDRGELMLAAARAMEGAAEGLATLATTFAAERRGEATWRAIKRSCFTVLAIGFMVMWLLVYGGLFGLRPGPTRESVAVIPIEGEIDQSARVSADRVVPLIRAACGDEHIKGVVLRITSPGGSPTEAQRMARALDACRGKTGSKPVIAMIEGLGASAAYLLASHADRVIANDYALVGSIGAVMSGFDVSDGLTKLGVREQTYASGELKTTLSPWHAATPAQARTAQSLVDAAGRVFADDVRARRGERLAKDAKDLFSGRLWVAADAKALGLIDDVGIYDDVLKDSFGDLPAHRYEPEKTVQDTLRLQSFAVGVLRELIGARATSGIK